MRADTKIVIAEDDLGHFALIRKNLQRCGITNEIIHCADGRILLDFLQCSKQGRTLNYLLFLDIRMPGIDGFGVLKLLKDDPDLRKIPVIILTTANNPMDIELCHSLGCSLYIVKPVEYDKFSDVIQRIGKLLSIIEVPHNSLM